MFALMCPDCRSRRIAWSEKNKGDVVCLDCACEARLDELSSTYLPDAQWKKYPDEKPSEDDYFFVISEATKKLEETKNAFRSTFPEEVLVEDDKVVAGDLFIRNELWDEKSDSFISMDSTMTVPLYWLDNPSIIESPPLPSELVLSKDGRIMKKDRKFVEQFSDLLHSI